MASVPVVDPDADPYAVLGVSRGATAEQIKHAFRVQAKTAHPDAGGSPEAMNRLNRAYDILGNAVSRRDFDRRREAEANEAAEHVRTSTRRASQAAESGRAAASGRTGAAAPGEGVTHAERLRQARAYVWSHLEEFGWLAAAAAAILSFSATRTTVPAAWVLGVLGFIPLYWLVLQFVYIAVPELKLTTYDTLRSPVRASATERRTLFIVGVLWLPLGLVWAAILSSI